MSHNLTETPARGGVITVPDPGDARNAASVDLPFGQIANRIAYLELHSLGAYNFNFAIPMTAGVWDPAFVGEWDFFNQAWQQHAVGGAAHLDFDLCPPPGLIITGLTVGMCGVSASSPGPRSALPSTMPTVKLINISPPTTPTSTGNILSTDTITDPSPNIGAYSVWHTVSLTGLARQVLDSSRWVLRVTGEAGTNSVVDSLNVGYAYLICAAP